MKKVGLVSLGCPKNLVDSEIMLGLLKKAGFEIIADQDAADILIVNTCSFIEDAKKESVDAILEAALIKKRFPGKKLVIAGCLPQRYKDELIRSVPEADAFVGTGDYHRIVDILRECEKGKVIKEIGAPLYIHNVDTPRLVSTGSHMAYIKIADGCQHACSYCIIPKIRGRYRSRSIGDIAAEARLLVKKGVKELVLIAQDTTSYGSDLKGGSDLTKLLRRLSAIKGDFWIRIMYAYPSSVTDELIEEIAANKKVCKYLDIPIQHISDRILKKMNRKEGGAFIRRLVKELRERIDGLSLRTSVICGFPGETEKDFNELLAFVKEGYFNNLGAFVYSREEGTSAARMKGQVSKRTALKRRDIIMSAQKKISLSFNRGFAGKELKVLVDSFDGEKLLCRSYAQARDIDGLTFIRSSNKKDAKKAGRFCRVKILRVTAYDLVG